MHVKLSKSEGGSIIRRKVGKKWQQYWDGENSGGHLQKSTEQNRKRHEQRRQQKRTSHYEQNENWRNRNEEREIDSGDSVWLLILKYIERN